MEYRSKDISIFKNRAKIFILAFLVVQTICTSCDKNKDYTTGEKPGVEEESLNKSALMPVPDGKTVMVAAHRGSTKDTPENSLSGIQKCIEIGADIIEFDIRITYDRNLVLIHDNTLERTTNGNGKVSYATLETLKKLYLKDKNGNLTNEHILTLEEGLNLIKGKDVYVFIDKAELLISEVTQVLANTSTFKQSMFLDFENIDATKQRYGNLLKSTIYVPGVHHTNTDLGNYILNFDKELAPSIYAFWIKDENSIVLPYIPIVKNNKRWVWINTTEVDQCAGHTDLVSLTNPDQGWGWAVAKGANIIFTDYPADLIEYLKAKNLHK